MSLRLSVWLILLFAGMPVWAAPLLTVVYQDQRREFTAEDLAGLPKTEAEAVVRGEPHRYRGVAVRDVLARLGLPSGRDMRGAALSLVVRAEAADGYAVVFALAEFDAAFRSQAILLADTRDGAPLPPWEGPLQIICPGDLRGARSVRQVVSLEVIPLPSARPRQRMKAEGAP